VLIFWCLDVMGLEANKNDKLCDIFSVLCCGHGQELSIGVMSPVGMELSRISERT
jgi:hypothetical protein